MLTSDATLAVQRAASAEHRRYHRSGSPGTCAHAYTFTYDRLGNRLTQMTADGATTTYTYNPASELLGTDLGCALTMFGYDAVGNTVRESGPGIDVTYTWDAENRLVEVDGTCMNDCPDPCD